MASEPRNAIVTGGSRGIGAAAALALAEGGYRVVLGCRHSEDCEPVVQRIRDMGGDADAVRCDVRRFEDARQLVEAARSAYGEINALINNAGTMDPVAPIADCDPGSWGNAIAVNLLGTFHCAHAALASLLTAESSVIVNLSTGAASHPLAGWSAYCTSKAGVSMFTRVLAEELAGTSVRVYGFRPGMVNTQMTREALKVKVNRASELDPDEFPGPESAGRAIAWLCAECLPDLNGQELDLLDGESRRRFGLPASSS